MKKIGISNPDINKAVLMHDQIFAERRHNLNRKI